MKSNPLCLVIWLLLVCCIYLVLLGGPYRDLTIAARLPWTILALVSTLLLHEVTHALMAKCLCKGTVRIEFAKDPTGLPSLRTLFPGNISRARRLIIVLAPMVLLSVLPLLFILFIKPVFYLFMVSMINWVGCFFDLTDIMLLITSGQDN